MKAELDNLIQRFRITQDQAVEFLVSKLGIPLPDSNRAWYVYCRDSGLYSVSEMRGVAVQAHGYGVGIESDNLSIDFDWGDHGEPDGFDGWRLYSFSLDHSFDFSCTHAECNEWLEQSHRAGELVRDTHLYYDPRFRARH